MMEIAPKSIPGIRVRFYSLKIGVKGKYWPVCNIYRKWQRLAFGLVLTKRWVKFK